MRDHCFPPSSSFPAFLYNRNKLLLVHVSEGQGDLARSGGRGGAILLQVSPYLVCPTSGRGKRITRSQNTVAKNTSLPLLWRIPPPLLTAAAAEGAGGGGKEKEELNKYYGREVPLRRPRREPPRAPYIQYLGPPPPCVDSVKRDPAGVFFLSRSSWFPSAVSGSLSSFHCFAYGVGWEGKEHLNAGHSRHCACQDTARFPCCTYEGERGGRRWREIKNCCKAPFLFRIP